MTFRQAQAAALALAAMIALADERLASAEASAGSKSFRHRRSSLVARGRASHCCDDVIVNPRTEAVIEASSHTAALSGVAVWPSTTATCP